ncbi:MAG: hypothetical protein OES32_04655 [Acidobacteriota bacterium]|nr:hypothetical protein [Acidobacteriota bacterium]
MAVALAGVSSAQTGAPPPAAGFEFQANTNTTGAQTAPDVAARADGSFVVVWESDVSSGDDSDGTSVQVRRFAADGAPLDPAEVQVNTFTTGPQRAAAVGARPDGSFVVSWASGAVGSEDILARRFAADGTPLDPADFIANTYTSSSQSRPEVSVDAAGNFVLTWSSLGSLGNDGDGESIQARRYAADGTPLDATEFQVNTVTASNQFDPHVAFTPGGDFVVVWSTDTAVRGRRFAADGTPLDASDFDASTAGVFTFSSSVDTTSDDGFVVAWGSFAGGPEDPEIEARRFAADATPLDPTEFRVNALTAGGQIPGVVTAAPDDSFVVSFASDGSFGDDTSADSAQARQYRADGTAVEANEFQLNSYTTQAQNVPRIDILTSGDLVAVWPSQGSLGDDDDNWSVQVRRFLLRQIFADGFESGDTSAWSGTVP